ncbi:MAG: diguanylate cyclase [Dokdonella sp.]
MESRHWRKLVRWCTFALLAGCAFVRAEGVPIAVDRLERDPAQTDAAAVIAGAYRDQFHSEAYAALTPMGDREVWYRVHLASDWRTERPPVLSIFDPQGLDITAYAPPTYAGVVHSIYSAKANAGFTRHALVVILPAALSATTPIYLRVAPERAIPRRICIHDITQARVSDLARGRLDVLFPAIQLATLLVMLSFFVVLRERMYAYFVGLVGFTVVYELYAFGIGYELFPLDLFASLGARPMWVAAAAGGFFLIVFSIQFLELDRSAPRLDRLIRLFRWPLGALALCAAIPPLSNGWWVEEALALTMLFVAPLLIVAGVVSWQHGGRRGGFYLCAWIPGLLFLIVRALQLIARWPLPEWLEFALPAALAFASVVLAFGLSDYSLSMRHERDVAHRLAEHDELTGALNRRAILDRLRTAFLHARESFEPLSVLFLDLDHFKRLNDSYGHRAGDQCLRAVVVSIAGELRQGEALGRYGGEEFLIVLPGASSADAQVVAERIRNRVETMPLLVSGLQMQLTLSIGVAALDLQVHSAEDLIECADAALYRAKSGGRNLVSTHPGSTGLFGTSAREG